MKNINIYFSFSEIIVMQVRKSSCGKYILESKGLLER